MVLSLWCGGCPLLLEVRAGPPFSGPSVFLMLVVGPSFLELGLVFPCSSGVGPSFLGCGGWAFLLGGCPFVLWWGQCPHSENAGPGANPHSKKGQPPLKLRKGQPPPRRTKGQPPRRKGQPPHQEGHVLLWFWFVFSVFFFFFFFFFLRFFLCVCVCFFFLRFLLCVCFSLCFFFFFFCVFCVCVCFFFVVCFFFLFVFFVCFFFLCFSLFLFFFSGGGGKTKNVSFEDLENFQTFNFQFWCVIPNLKIENLKVSPDQKKKDKQKSRNMKMTKK